MLLHARHGCTLGGENGKGILHHLEFSFDPPKQAAQFGDLVTVEAHGLCENRYPRPAEFLMELGDRLPLQVFTHNGLPSS